jgi:predicted ATP-grasp superfamily ATP-dependent carboligase
MYGICNELDIPFPYTYSREEKIESFPVFYKSDHETSALGKIRGIARSQDDLNKLPSQGILVQEYIPTPSTFGVGFIAQDGKLLTHFMHEELLSHPKEGGSGVVLKRIDDEKLLQYTLRLVAKLKYHGWGLAEFKYCKRRQDYVFMEINAKFWASFEFALRGNPLFGKLLFGLNYPAKSSVSIVYVHRLLLSNPVNWLKYLPQIVTGHRTLSGGWRKPVASVVQIIVKLFKH